MRSVYLVTYDISDPDRLRTVFKLMRRRGEHLQLSVFRCYLSRRERIRLEAELAEVVHHREDQVLFVDLGPEEGRGDQVIQALGRPMAERERAAVVV